MVSFDFFIAHFNKAVNSCNVGRNWWFNVKRFRNFKRCNPWFNRVDDVIFNLFKFIIGNVAFNCNNFCVLNNRAFTGSQKLNALCGRICSLVILPRQKFSCKIPVIFRNWKFGINIVKVWLWKNLLYRKIKFFFGKALCIVTVDNS